MSAPYRFRVNINCSDLYGFRFEVWDKIDKRLITMGRWPDLSFLEQMLKIEQAQVVATFQSGGTEQTGADSMPRSNQEGR